MLPVVYIYTHHICVCLSFMYMSTNTLLSTMFMALVRMLRRSLQPGKKLNLFFSRGVLSPLSRKFGQPGNKLLFFSRGVPSPPSPPIQS